jgi:long-chain acyl-CoA synthetase
VEKIWLKSYPHGVPEQVPTPEFRSIRELIEHSFQEYPENPAYTNMGTTITYRDLDELSMQFACYLQKNLGMTRGERVAIMLPNIIQYPVAMCGAFRAGLVVVNVNPLYTARELKHQLSDSGAKCIVILENFAHILEEVIDDTEVEHVITTGVGDLLSFPKNLLVNFVLRHVKREVPRYKFGNSVTFRHALRDGANEQLSHVEIGLADIAYLQYTGGTTGVSKGAMLSHRNMVYNVEQSIRWQGEAYDGVEPLVAITALPLYHIFSLQGNCLLVMAQGGLNVLITNPRDMPGFVKEISKFRFNLLTGVNTMFAGLLNTPGFSDIEFSPLRVVVGGGMAVQPAVAREWHKVTGKPILQGYGLTETSPAAVCNTIDSEFTGSIGLPIPSTEAMIAGDDGNELHVGEIGEICLKGPQVMEGYWQRPAETVAAHGRHRAHGRGWLHLYRRPQERHDPRLGFQRLPQRNRERGRGNGRHTRGCGDRGCRREIGRGREGVRGPHQPEHHRAGRYRTLPGEPDRLQAAENRRVSRRTAENQRRQDLAPCAAR